MKVKINETWPIELPDERADFHAQRPGWERKRTESMFKNIKKGDVLVDVGTELGDYDALYALWGAKVICIEPQPKYWPIIKQYFDMNGVQPLACFAGFASTVNEPNPPLADFEVGNDGVWPKVANLPLEDWNGFRNMIETGVSTPQLTLDELCSGNKVDMITIDVEGAEFEVLKGAQRILTDDKPMIYLSLHPTMLAHDWGQTPEQLYEYLQGFGYDWAFLDKDHEEHWVCWNTKARKVAA